MSGRETTQTNRPEFQQTDLLRWSLPRCCLEQLCGELQP